MYKQELTTNNITPWRNTREYIIVHHTWTKHGTIKWVLNTLTKWNVSCHYVVNINWDMYKIWSTDNILWHTWISEWKWKKNMNNYSIWIEVVWWAGEEFPFIQREAVKKLIEHLMFTFKIPKENVLRHKDIAPNRKNDIADIFWNNKYASWKDYQDSCKPNKF